MKSADGLNWLDARGRWILTSSRRDQQSADARRADGLSAFSALVAQGLVANSEADRDGDGYVTIDDVSAFVGPKLEAQTAQQVSFRFDGSGALVVALAPGHSTDYELIRPWAVLPNGSRIPVPEIPTTSSTRIVETELPVIEGALATAPARASDPASTSGGLTRDALLMQLQLDEGEFVALILSALDTNQQSRVRQLIQLAARESARLVDADASWPALTNMLDKLTCATATFMNHDEPEWASRAIEALVRVYERGFDSNGFRKSSVGVGSIGPAELWYAMLERILALGALAVRLKLWSQVAELALQRPDGYDFRDYNNWMRHAVTESARANLFRIDVNGQPQDQSALVVAREYCVTHESLTPDLAPEDDDRLLTSLCQFDFLACLAAIVKANSLSGSNFYPNFGRFHTDRAEPVVRLLLSDQSLREAIAAVPDDDLAILLKGLSDTAARESFRFNGWRGFADPTILDWFAKTGLQL
jgi:hypothetical protein